MEILDGIQKGKEFTTRSGFRAKFVALLPVNVPARLVVDVYYKNVLERSIPSSIPTTENYYLDGKYNSQIENHMDLVVADDYLDFDEL